MRAGRAQGATQDLTGCAVSESGGPHQPGLAYRFSLNLKFTLPHFASANDLFSLTERNSKMISAFYEMVTASLLYAISAHEKSHRTPSGGESVSGGTVRHNDLTHHFQTR